MIYLDANATMPVKPAVKLAVMEALDRHGNPSSVHRYGRIARRTVEESRRAVAGLVNAKPTQVVFTSGGTEANNLVLRGLDVPSIYVSSIEHDSVLSTVPEASRLPVDVSGRLDLGRAAEILSMAPSRSLISVMLVNNETGVIQSVAELAALAKTKGHLVHCDAVQAAGRLPIDMSALGVDALTLSAHKIGAVQGVGALIVADNLPLKAQQVGGGQEMRRRAGTENVSGIMAFGMAARLAADDLLDMPRLARLRDELQACLQSIGGDDVVVLGRDAPRVANTLSVALRGVSSETQVMAMDLAGIAVSAGSACSSGKVRVSHVAKAMGYDDDVAGGTLRLSLGWHTNASDVARAIDVWRSMYERSKRNSKSQAA